MFIILFISCCLCFFNFNIIITYHVSLYFIFLSYIIWYLINKKYNKSSLIVLLLLLVVFFWGFFFSFYYYALDTYLLDFFLLM